MSTVRLMYYKEPRLVETHTQKRCVGVDKVPITADNNPSAEGMLPSTYEKEAIFKQWPQAKGNLFMFWQGQEFRLD